MKNKWVDLRNSSVLSAIAFGLRFVFRSKILYHWDSVNFALSLDQYDVRAHQPHPPGYFLYSMLGKIFNIVFKDANTSLVWISLISGVLGVIIVYFFTLKLFDRPTALIASVISLTSPLHWFFSEVALSYTLEFVMVTLLAWLAYKQMTESENKTYIMFAFLLGIAGGIRQNDLLFLFPLWIFCLYFLSWRQRVMSFIVLGATIGIWLVPMMSLSGGFSGYMSALNTESGKVLSESSLFSFQQLLFNGFRLGMYLIYGLMLMIIPLIIGILKVIKNYKTYLSDKRLWLFSLWLTPSFLFYLFIHIRQPGHIFTFFPALIILSAAAVQFFPTDSLKKPAYIYKKLFIIFAIVLNISFFAFVPASLFGSERLPLQTPGINSLKNKDLFWQNRIRIISEEFDTEETILFAGGLNFRHLDYYFGDYQLPGLSHYYGDGVVEFPENVNTFVVIDKSLGNFIFSDQRFDKLEVSQGEYLYFITWQDDQNAWLDQNHFIME